MHIQGAGWRVKSEFLLRVHKIGNMNIAGFRVSCAGCMCRARVAIIRLQVQHVWCRVQVCGVKCISKDAGLWCRMHVRGCWFGVYDACQRVQDAGEWVGFFLQCERCMS